MVFAGSIGRASANEGEVELVTAQNEQENQTGSSSSAPSSPPSIMPSPRRKSCSSSKSRRKSHHKHRSHKSRRSGPVSTINDRESIYYLNSGDHPGALMVVDKLVGEFNYASWANAMKLSLLSRRKINFVNGKIQKPEDRGGKEYEAWETVNGLVLSWTVNSVLPQISSSLMHTEEASIA